MENRGADVNCVRNLRKGGLQTFLLALVCCGVGGGLGWEQGTKPSQTEPEVFSIFPLAGQQGRTWAAEIRGRGLAGAYAVWSDCEALQATIKSIETIDSDSNKSISPQDKKPALQRVVLEMRLASVALVGIHSLRLLCARGISNSFSLYVEREAVLLENVSASSSPFTAQQIQFPGVVSGKIKEEGEVDYFAIRAKAGSRLSFEVNSGGADFDPVITLYEPAGSWFDPQRLKRLDYNDDVSSRTAFAAGLTRRFRETGRYLLGVSAFVGLGKPDYCYRLRVTESQSLEEKSLPEAKAAHPEPLQWREREFTRQIEPDRLKTLWSRGVRVIEPVGSSFAHSVTDTNPDAPGRKSTAPLPNAPAVSSAVAELRVVRESEPNDLPAEALEITIPAIIEGTVGFPGDLDHYRIRVSAGQALTFEIQTLLEVPPLFSPYLEALDSNDVQLFNNVYQRIGGDGDDWVQSLEPKCLYTFEKSGEYLLRVRDLTSRSGSTKFVYRLLVRPQIPHAGDIDIKADRFNLVPGQAEKLTVTTGQEEGFGGQIAVAVENLPVGVVVLPASDVQPAEGPPFAKVHPERFVPRSDSLALMLYAESDAPATADAVWARVKIQPIVGGKPGSWLQVGQLPVMVVKNPLAVGLNSPSATNATQP